MMEYKGYLGRSTVDEKEGLIFGEVIGLRDVITYQGRTVEEAERAFRESIDLYLQTCAEEGIEPDKQFSGKLLIRTKPSVHRLLAVISKARGKSINAFAEQILMQAVSKMRHPIRAMKMVSITTLYDPEQQAPSQTRSAAKGHITNAAPKASIKKAAAEILIREKARDARKKAKKQGST
jgi:predicted HicB family RNase H-like nuclease